MGEPPLAELSSLQAAVKISTGGPPSLPQSDGWSAGFRSFVSACLVKEFRQRPSASELLQHPFIRNAPGAEVLLESLAASIRQLERGHEHVDIGSTTEWSSSRKRSSGRHALCGDSPAAGTPLPLTVVLRQGE